MKEFEFYVSLIKRIIDSDNGKETVFYDSGEWYSRRHCRIITLDELAEMANDALVSFDD